MVQWTMWRERWDYCAVDNVVGEGTGLWCSGQCSGGGGRDYGAVDNAVGGGRGYGAVDNVVGEMRLQCSGQCGGGTGLWCSGQCSGGGGTMVQWTMWQERWDYSAVDNMVGGNGTMVQWTMWWWGGNGTMVQWTMWRERWDYSAVDSASDSGVLKCEGPTDIGPRANLR
jgi:hypothetical protein